MKMMSTAVLLGALAAMTGCQSMDGMMDKMPMHSMNAMLNDAQIVSVLHTANMGEIQQAQIALQKSQNAAVKTFAQKMIDDHTANDQKAMAMAASMSVSPQTNPTSMKLQKESDEIVMKLNQADAKDFDKTYMDCQVKVHKMVLDTIDKKLIPHANNSDLRTHLMMTRTAVAGHHAMAEQIKTMMK